MKRSKSRVNSSFDLTQCMDIERCQEELLKIRTKYNKLNQNYLQLKVEYNKLQKSYRHNIAIIQSIIKEANISALSEYLEDPKMNLTNKINENDNNDIIKQNSLSKTTIKILKEKSIYEKLKLEIMSLRDEIKSKENTINDLKDNAKTSKFRELDNKYAQIFQEYNAVKARNQVLETMQIDYVNSKNQILFLLKQIDLYKKENKKLKELYEKILFDFQNISREKDVIENSKNTNEERVRALMNKNQSLKIKYDDLRLKNLAYYEELEKYKNISQGQIDKILNRKEKEISQYRNQIVQLKMEISDLQRKAEERNKISINSANNTGFKQVKQIFPNKKENNKELRKTDSDFFVTNPKSIIPNDKKKIVINSKISEIKHEKKITIIKIRDNKEGISPIKLEDKHDNSDILNNFYEKKNSFIKGEKNINDKKTTTYEEDININLDNKREDTNNKDQKEKFEEKEKNIQENNNISKEVKVDDVMDNNNNEKNINVDNKIDTNNKKIEKESEFEEENEEEDNDHQKKENNMYIEDNKEEINEKEKEKDNEMDKGKEEGKDKEKEKEKEKEIKKEKEKEDEKDNLINNNEKSEEMKKSDENKSKEYIQKYKEDEIVANISNDNDKSNNKEKKNESTYGYNDFESNLDQRSSFKQNSNTNNLNNIINDPKDMKDMKTLSVEQNNNSNNEAKNSRNDSKVKNSSEDNKNKIFKESNIIEGEQKSQSKDNIISQEKSVKKDEEKKEEGDEEYKFSSRNEELSEQNI